jgi:hypothetical protein
MYCNRYAGVSNYGGELTLSAHDMLAAMGSPLIGASRVEQLGDNVAALEQATFTAD